MKPLQTLAAYLAAALLIGGILVAYWSAAAPILGLLGK